MRNKYVVINESRPSSIKIKSKDSFIIKDIPKESIVIAELNTSSGQCSTYLKTENALSEFVGTTLKDQAVDNLGIPKLVQDIVDKSNTDLDVHYDSDRQILFVY